MHRKMVFFIGMLVILASLSTVSAEIDCIDDTTLQINTSKTICINADCDIINQTENIVCPYNCSWTEKECKPTPFNQNLYFIGIIVFFMLIVALVWKRFS